MTRPVLTREARERCNHPKSVAIRSDLPNSYDGRQWCAACGVFFRECEETDPQTDWIDWPATEAADREQLETEGQMRLPE